MSVTYSVDMTLNLPYTEKAIKCVLLKGAEGRFIYFGDYFSQKVLSIDDAVQKSLYEDLEDNTRHVLAKFEDTRFFVWFFKSDDDRLTFSIGSFGYRWDKDFSNGKQMRTIDFARYMRLMLDICKDIPLLDLHTFADNLEDIIDDTKNCVVAAVDFGFFGEKYPGGNEIIKSSIEYVLSNAFQNKFVFFDEFFDKQIEPSMQKLYDILKADFPINLYAKKDNVPFKIEIKKDQQGNDFVSIYPVEPYLMKKGYESDREKLDGSFYVQRLLELCENFAIYELKTFF